MSAAQHSTRTVEQLMHRSLLEVFNERDADRRAAAIAAVYTPDVTFHEPDAAIHGPAALGVRVQQLLDRAPGWVFQPSGTASVNHDLGRLTWRFGPEGGPAVVTGMDVAIVDAGRIRALYVFIDGPAEGAQP